LLVSGAQSVYSRGREEIFEERDTGTGAEATEKGRRYSTSISRHTAKKAGELKAGRTRNGNQTSLLQLKDYLLASASHFFINDDFAAPASGLPSFPTALLAHAAETLLLLPASHFLMKEVFAAPASGFPFLSIAWDSQLDPAAVGAGLAVAAEGAVVWAHAIPTEKHAATATAIILFIAILREE